MELAGTAQRREQAGLWVGSGDTCEWENGKQIQPGEGHRVLTINGGEQDRLEERVAGKTTALLLLSRAYKRRCCLEKDFLQITCGLRCTETAKQ